MNEKEFRKLAEKEIKKAVLSGGKPRIITCRDCGHTMPVYKIELGGVRYECGVCLYCDYFYKKEL
ncbi:MAG: hypothetical protein Q4E35_09780 [Eubacteriales bacterium]|nr:hypothetical protein [Eubacteriales bacterium]